MTAPTAMSALPSLESQLANITGKTVPAHPPPITCQRNKGISAIPLLLPCPVIHHELARALYSPGQNLTTWSNEVTGPCTLLVIYGGQRALRLVAFLLNAGVHSARWPVRPPVILARLPACSEAELIAALPGRVLPSLSAGHSPENCGAVPITVRLSFGSC